MNINFAHNRYAETIEQIWSNQLLWHLQAELPDRIVSFNPLTMQSPEGPIWGPDPHEVLESRNIVQSAFLRDPKVQNVIGMEEIDIHSSRVAELMQHKPCIIRNPERPLSRLRYSRAGDRLDQHFPAVFSGARTAEHEGTLFLQATPDMGYQRRILVVDNKITGDSPYSFEAHNPKSGGRIHIPSDELQHLHAADQFQPLTTQAPDGARRLVLDHAHAILDQLDLPYAVMDIGLIKENDGSYKAGTDVISVRPPGADQLYFCDPAPHAAAIIDALARIEPDFDLENPYDAPGL